MRRIVHIDAPVAAKAAAMTADAFAPFGEFIDPPRVSGNTDWSGTFANPRPHARIVMFTSHVEPVALPATLKVMERHPHSFQTFLPLNVGRYLVCAAPNGEDDLPVVSQLRAFIVGAGYGITYRANVWHCPIAVLDSPAQFAVWMWKSGGDDDIELVDFSQPVTVQGA